METLFYKRIQEENLYESQFSWFRDEIILHLAFEFASNKNQAVWSTTSYST